MEDKIKKIVEDCNNLLAEEYMVVKEFGRNKDLTLFINKDIDYNPKVDKDKFNMVFINTEQNGICVDDLEEIHISNLYNELERLYNYMNFNEV